MVEAEGQKAEALNGFCCSNELCHKIENLSEKGNLGNQGPRRQEPSKFLPIYMKLRANY